MTFPPRPWAWEGGEVYVYDPQAAEQAYWQRALAYLPADPVEFLTDCAAWWAWLAEAHPGDIEREPVTGHLAHVGPGPAYWRERAAASAIGEQGGEIIVPESHPGCTLLKPRFPEPQTWA